jgi:DNA-binding NarL/FixJ family response regulator
LGYLSKSARRESLLTALRSVAQGNRYLPDDVARQLNVARVGPTITAREREVLNGIAAGLPNKQIASALDISEFTVKRHVSQILYKMSVNDRAQAVVEAIRRGLVKSP